MFEFSLAVFLGAATVTLIACTVLIVKDILS